MQRTTTTTTEHSKNLRRIAAVLLALADLAERASSRSLFVRSLVLWLLRSSEVLARDHLARLTRHAAGQSEPLPLADDSATEAIRLAAGFRQLAAALSALAAESPAPSQQAIAARWNRLTATNSLAALHGPASAVERRDSS